MANNESNRLCLSKRVKSETILEVRKALAEGYIFPDIAKKVDDCLEACLKGGVYDGIDNASAFALEIDKVLQDTSKDKHLHFYYNPEQAKDIIATRNLGEEEKKTIQERNLKRERHTNFGFQEIKILEGNVGYLDLRRFCHTDSAGETAVAAMGFLANSDAVIIDLRGNGGGEPEMVELLSSYFLKGRTQLNYRRRRAEGKIEQYWTVPHVSGKRLLDKDLYLLTSSQTFSAAEDFAYGLKCLGRAKVFGETTKGGAHPVDLLAFHGEFVLMLPTGESLNPISGGNWEGVGVKPDVTTPAEDAFETAHKVALKDLIDKTSDGLRKEFLRLALDELKAKSSTVSIDEWLLQSYVGAYGKCRISFANGVLYYEAESYPKSKLIPLTEDLFAFEGIESVRIRFVKNGNGGNMEMQYLYKEDEEIISKRKEN